MTNNQPSTAAQNKSIKTGRTIAVMQPYLLPYLGYYQLMAAADVFVLFDDVNYIKRGYINRNSLLLNGQSHRFTLPVAKASQNRLINEHELHGQPIELKSLIHNAYSIAPFADTALALSDQALSHTGPSLADFLAHSLRTVSEHLQLGCEIISASSLDYDRSGKGQDRILSLCNHFNASAYVNPPGGRELYDGETFEAANIELSFIDYQPRAYDQFGNKGEFVPYLSIIDSLANRTTDDIRDEILGYRLS